MHRDCTGVAISGRRLTDVGHRLIWGWRFIVFAFSLWSSFATIHIEIVHLKAVQKPLLTETSPSGSRRALNNSRSRSSEIAIAFSSRVINKRTLFDSGKIFTVSNFRSEAIEGGVMVYLRICFVVRIFPVQFTFGNSE